MKATQWIGDQWNGPADLCPQGGQMSPDNTSYIGFFSTITYRESHSPNVCSLGSWRINNTIERVDIRLLQIPSIDIDTLFGR